MTNLGEQVIHAKFSVLPRKPATRDEKSGDATRQQNQRREKRRRDGKTLLLGTKNTACNKVLDMSRRSSRLSTKRYIDYNEVKVVVEHHDKSVPQRKKALIKKEKKTAGGILKEETDASKTIENDENLVSRTESRSLHENDVPLAIKKELIKDELNHVSQLSAQEMFIGCHTSISGGLWKAPEEAMLFGAKAFALFLHNQQQWKMRPLADGHAQRFRETCEKLEYAPNQILPHGSYLMNCGSPREDVKEKSDKMLIEELKRCEELGLVYFNFHPGSTLGRISIDDCLTAIADAINKAHRATKYVIALLENMSCQGNTVGGKFHELRNIIEKVEDKSRIGVCIDTCHAHAAGYDLSSQEGYKVFTNDLEAIIGLKYVKAFHLNDSKGPSGCNKDRHESIGKGTIGLKGFERLVNDARFLRIPMILETPYKDDDIYKKEIKLLYSLIK